MEQEQIKTFKEDVKKNWLVMSRVPPRVKDEFIKYANDEFCGDYGMVLKQVWEQFKEYQFMKSQLFGNAEVKLNHIISLLENQSEPKSKEIKLLSGKSIKKEGKNE
jgi:hypothetical protein